ncbi:MAG: acetyl-CoA carboxylase biotin carboxyl carrier protein [Bryobacteraceae bacterium]
MTLDEIRELIQVVSDTGIAELEVQRGDNRVRIRAGHAQEFTAPPFMPASLPGSIPSAPATASGAGDAPPAHKPADPIGDPAVTTVKSPIVGTFYDSPAPGAATFVRVGDTVKPGDVLCIIESMKLMNEIEAETGGTIVAKFVTSGQPVEYGEALFDIRAS